MTMIKREATKLLFSILLLFLVLDGACLAVVSKQPAHLYVNVVVYDPSEAISAKLAEKIGKIRLLPSFMKRRMGKRLGKAAGRIVKPSMVAEKMAAKMTTKIPEKMATKGVIVDLNEHYREGPYFVVQMQVKQVDAATMAAAKTENKSMGARMQKFLTFIGAKNQETLENYLLPGMIERKLPDMMTEMMSEKMAEKGVKAEATVLPETKQDKHFEATLRKVRAAASQVVQEQKQSSSSSSSEL